jgi:hypothetical protein
MLRRSMMVLVLLSVMAIVGLAEPYETLCNCCGYSLRRVCDCDNFEGAEAADPSDTLLEQIASHYPNAETRECDVEKRDTWWAHTFSDIKPAGDCSIVGAFLCITVCNRGDNDHLKIGVMHDPSVSWTYPEFYNVRLNMLSPAIPLNACFTVTLDLSNLVHPTHSTPVNLLPMMNQFGWLDVVVDDDSSVDSAQLILVSGVK